MIGKNLNELPRVIGYTREELDSKRARMFPGGRLKSEDEVATCSLFLATKIGIKEFRERLLTSLSDKHASRITNQSAQLHAYTEIGKDKDRIDGLLVLTTGKKDKTIAWSAYIEVKTKGKLDEEQIDRYLKKAKEDGVSAVITISNDFVSYSDINPTGIKDKSLFHWSWKWLLSELNHLTHRSDIDDEDQVYMAAELIRYLQTHNDIKDFSDMGEYWEDDARKIVEGQKVLKKDESLDRLATAWAREEKDIGIKLSDTLLFDTGCHRVELDLTRDELKKDTAHNQKLKDQILCDGCLNSGFVINDLDPKRFASAASRKLNVSLKFRGRKLVVTFAVPATPDKKSSGQTSELLKALESSGMEDEVNIVANYGRKHSPLSTLKQLQEERENKEPYSIIGDEFKREEIKKFVLSYEKDLGRDFFRRRRVIEDIETSVIKFYSEIVARFVRT